MLHGFSSLLLLLLLLSVILKVETCEKYVRAWIQLPQANLMLDFCGHGAEPS
jgi:hypothetical protein